MCECVCVLAKEGEGDGDEEKKKDRNKDPSVSAAHKIPPIPLRVPGDRSERQLTCGSFFFFFFCKEWGCPPLIKTAPTKGAGTF